MAAGVVADFTHIVRAEAGVAPRPQHSSPTPLLAEVRLVVPGDNERQLSFCLNCSCHELIHVIQHCYSACRRQHISDATVQTIQNTMACVLLSTSVPKDIRARV